MKTMKLKFLILCTFVFGFVGLTASPTAAITVLWQSANTDIYLGEPYTSLEFENPLSGTEMIKEYAVKEWRDADYNSPPPWYDDWSVNDSAGIDGYANEIWMRKSGHSIWTSTTVPSTTVSIHLHGDDNDGLADVLVDGLIVARLDMGTLGPAGQNALIIVKNLLNITHHIRVNDLGVGDNTGGDDVATMGAAALEKRIKWSQPPIPGEPKKLYYGWNEISDFNGKQIVADDWVCDNDNPVTDIHWWGSFQGWTKQDDPPQMPTSFHITIWNDVPDPNPANPDTFSHPNEVVWEIDCINFDMRFAGWDYDPRTNCFETCYFFEQYLTEAEYFLQKKRPDGTPAIYWISIAAKYPDDVIVENPWGWKTRPRDSTSPAPDDAVRIRKPTAPHKGDKYADGEPIYWPDETQSWDMAFKLTTQPLLEVVKYEQQPDLYQTGIDVDATGPELGMWPPQLIADDFPCNQTGKITDIHIWGSWYEDLLPGGDPRNVIFYLSLHNNNPRGPYDWSEPNELLWTCEFMPGQFTVEQVPAHADEAYYCPCQDIFLPNNHNRVWKYSFYLDDAACEPFTQKEGTIYWLDVQAQPQTPDPQVRFGWKTSIEHWMDDAVWAQGTEQNHGPWWELRDPRNLESLDMAFAITTVAPGEIEIKWSQPPEPYTPKAYYGWNEYSVYNSDKQIVADDWFCDTDDPVTDIHWWGSFIGWPCQEPPEMPDSFHITIWTDVPADEDPNPEVWFSHPNEVIWEIDCSNFTYEFVGWDIDPRNPDALPEACFKFEQDLLEEEWFKQKRGDNIYWISIAAKYPTGVDVQYPWGWKMRLRDQNSRAPDDAVRIFDPTDPVWGSIYLSGEPIWWQTITQSYDAAFVLTTKEKPPKPPVPHLKWSQPPIEVDPNLEKPIYSGWDEPSFATPIAGTYDNMRVVADDYRCLGNMPVTSIHWWGSYYGMVEPGTMPPELPTSWKIGFWSNVPAPDGEWDIGDSHKMRYPQLPDPNGWDLDITDPLMSADDWECRKSGPVSDIHFWYSWLGDNVGTIEAIKVRIYDNVPDPDPGDPATFSHPGTVQWSQDFLPGQFTTRLWDKGKQGFITPPPTNPIPDDHDNIYQCNIVNIPPPWFYQTAGEIYWLAITIKLEPAVNARIGWKTSGSKQFMDDAVYLTPAVPVAWVPWTDPETGDSMDLAFVITNDPNYSRPEKLLWQIEVPEDQVEVEEVGTDFYHHQYPNDVAYQYTLHLEPNDVFWQGDYLEDTTDDIFWLSIVAVYESAAGTDPVHPWGWKTRPWHWMDDAVRFWFDGPLEPGMVLEPHTINPIKDPLYGESFDVAFELDTDPNYIKWEQPFIGIRRWPHYEDEKSMAREVTTTENVVKWAQKPDLTDAGVDVDATDAQIDPPPYDAQLLADDFNCVTPETIDDIHIYGSWKANILPGDLDPGMVEFTLSIHKDIPKEDSPTGYSMPGDMIWSEDYGAHDFSVELLPTTAQESYYIPCAPEYFLHDHTRVYKYSFFPSDPFHQKGTETDPIIYWLDVQARPQPYYTEARFGWKTRDPEDGHFNDDATWVRAVEPYNGDDWQELRYPIGFGNPYEGQSMDLAFELTTNRVTTELIIDRLVADDWRCDHNTPVTDAVWWGSYIGYRYKPCHGQIMQLPVKPDYFWLTIWSDVPADADSSVPFSHPNEIMWEYRAYEYDEVLVGYDKHPHGIPGASRAREPVFRYSVRLPKEQWFQQRDVNDIYWFSVVAVYEADSDPLYDWGWTNHKYVFNDDAVAGSVDAAGDWSWTELLDQLKMSQDMSFMLFTDPDCFPYDHPDYSVWNLVGKPDCWCFPRQCRGDADGEKQGSDFFGWMYVGTDDLDILIDAWKILDPPKGPGLSGNQICADFDHARQGSDFFGWMRVGTDDLDVLIAHWKVLEPPKGPGVPPDCP